ncbi:DUF1836 domain-containing protein [Paenibacillus crassostreae]|uniref:DUF1836 domain-containing protein n=1 Tax=Paenibacillus crassostreae TaxID=1763538 RepID=A0A167AK44_9BACL|nr:DUF1836 domain-containing protein [Paenibacillus crassostreae]AOZ92406.1 hypothetical protein LPB68_09285 [Paenibacillus crassostreae]OAB71121.1 hypothetical protein PNBC_21435 [Paenibacillus crassostreae]
METLSFTRKDMANLLLSLKENSNRSPRSIIQDIWRANHQSDMSQASSMSAFISTSLPPIIEKMIRSDVNPTLSLQDIVSLGTLIEYTHFSITSVQNWVKRDFKNIIGHAEAGKKYSLQQIALFLIIEDLRSTLDYDTIRKFFQIIFRLSNHEKANLHTITPLHFYTAYAGLFEEIDERFRSHIGDHTDFGYKWDKMINEIAKDYVTSTMDLSNEQKETLQTAIYVALTSVHTSCFQSLSRRYVNGLVFLHNLHE